MVTNVGHPRVSILTQRLQLRAGVGEYLLDLGLLIAVKLKPVKHLQILLSTRLSAALPFLVDIQPQSARRKSQYKDKYRRDANLPFPVANLFHNYFTTSSSVS